MGEHDLGEINDTIDAALACLMDEHPGVKFMVLARVGAEDRFSLLLASNETSVEAVRRAVNEVVDSAAVEAGVGGPPLH
jgi:hypothetical protein